MTFAVTSNSFKDGDYLGKDLILSADFGFGCAGGNKSPHLKWSGAPAGTKSFAVTCYDPDAPTGSGFWHWLVVNIPRRRDRACAGRRQRRRHAAGGRVADAHRFRRARLWRPLPAGRRPSASLSVHGVCGRRPTSSTSTADTSAAVVGFNLHFNTLAKAAIMGLFKR